MQIQNNYSYRPNFGMAMRIYPEAQKVLRNSSLETLKDLREIGEDLKGTHFYDLVIDHQLSPRIMAKDGGVEYIAPFMYNKPVGRFMLVNCNCSSAPIGKPSALQISCQSEEEAVKAYEKLSIQKSNYKRTAEIVKLLDADTERQAAARAAKKAEQAEAAKLADALLNDFAWID